MFGVISGYAKENETRRQFFCFLFVIVFFFAYSALIVFFVCVHKKAMFGPVIAIHPLRVIDAV